MKLKLRLIACIVALATVLLSLSSCRFYGELFLWLRGDWIDRIEIGTNADGDPEWMEYTLTEEDLKDCAAAVERCTEVLLKNESRRTVEEALYEVDRLTTYIMTQEQVAFLLFCMDQSDGEAAAAYETATEAVNRCRELYYEMCQALYASDSKYKEEFFSDWSESELLLMQSYTEEASVLSNANSKLFLEYRQLEESEFQARSAEIYLETVKNNRALAGLYGYDSYPEYAYEILYQRDYRPEELSEWRAAIANELTGLLEEAEDAFERAYAGLSTREQELLREMMIGDYESIAGIDLKRFAASVSQSMGDSAELLLDRGASVFSEHEDAYEGAFTVYLYSYGYPVCYFGPGVQDVMTVTHELGHFYATLAGDAYDASIDLSEMHSQGAVWMLIASMDETVGPGLAHAAEAYWLCTSLQTILISSIVSEFEEWIYTFSDTQSIDPDAVMETVAKDYGGVEWLSMHVADPMEYWRYSAVESPMYYISYAVSGLSALELYCKVKADPEEGAEIYSFLSEDADMTKGFCETAVEAGLTHPLELRPNRDLGAVLTR